ncbi:MAG: GAF domain-containing protein [Cyanobacteriota bacterium]|nr:GAF domain-containing protein [Cyanobacteriota bacterium]
MVQSIADKPLVALQTVLQQMREQTDAKILIELTLDYIRNIFVAPLIWLAIYDYANHQLVGQGGVTLLEDGSILQAAFPLQPGEIMEQVVIEQRPISLPDMSQEPRMGIWQREAKRLGGIQGCLIYPMRGQRRCQGVLMLGSQVWGITTSDEEKALLGILLGQLSASLQQLETMWKQQTERRVDDPLITLGTAMRDLPTLDERVEAVINQLQTFMGVGRVRVYWFERENMQFVLRWGGSPLAGKGAVNLPPNLGKGKGSPANDAKSSHILTTRDLGDMYYTLADGQVVAAAEAMGTTRSEVTPKLMQQLRAQAILAAPIVLAGDLMGFISVESEVPRPWPDVERQMIAGAANWLSLAAPLDQLEIKIQQVQGHQALIAQINRAIYAQMDLVQILQQVAVEICQRLHASACGILLFDPTSQTFRLFHEHRNEGKKPFPKRFASLSPQDWEDLMRMDAVVAENYNQDLRLLSWRQELTETGARSVLLAQTGTEDQPTSQPIDGAILVTHQQLRAWGREERQLVRAVAQQIGLALRQSNLTQLQQQQAQLLDGLIQNALFLQSLTTPAELYATLAQGAAQLLGASLGVAVVWQPGDPKGYVQDPFSTSADFKLVAGTEVDLLRDPLIGHCLHASEPQDFGVEQLTSATRGWLSAAGLGRVLGMNIGSQGVLVLGAEAGHVWEPEERAAVALLASITSAALQRLLWSQTLMQRSEALTELNWYKHRRLFDYQASLMDNLKRLGQVQETPGDEHSRWQKVVDIARSLRDLTIPNQHLLKAESWQPDPERVSVPVASLIRRTLRRLESLVQKRKLWPRVHGDTGVAILGDPGRLEMVLYEILTAAALRSPEEGRLEIWNQDNSGFLELVLADGGEFDPALMQALQLDPEMVVYADPLAPSILKLSPGQELSLCQRVIHRMGGQLTFYQAQDGRNITRLLMPLAPDGVDPAEL